MQILLIDDELTILEALEEMLELEGFSVTCFSDPESALAQVQPDMPAVILSDVRMPGLDGLALLGMIKAIDADLPVVLMSGHGDIPMAIAAVKEGAFDFLEKPLTPEKLIIRLQQASEQRAQNLQDRKLQQNPQGRPAIEQFIIGEAPATQQIREQVLALSQTSVDTIIYGETGSGKDVVARALHEFSHRHEQRFVAINCGGMTESIIESELFGHEAGSFTSANRRHIGKIEAANGGTLFLDEIESMPISVQIKLLRVLQDRCIERVGGSELIPVSLTVIAASKDDLAQMSERGEFRKDLYYRLNVASLRIPPLRERPEDAVALFRYYSLQAGQRFSKLVPALEPEQIMKLQQYDWPGNVRELKNAADRFVIGIAGDGFNLARTGEQSDDQETGLESRIDEYERQLIIEALKANQGIVNKAADYLSLTRKTLYRKMKKHALDKWDFKLQEE